MFAHLAQNRWRKGGCDMGAQETQEAGQQRSERSGAYVDINMP